MPPGIEELEITQEIIELYGYRNIYTFRFVLDLIKGSVNERENCLFDLSDLEDKVKTLYEVSDRNKGNSPAEWTICEIIYILEKKLFNSNRGNEQVKRRLVMAA